VSGDLGVLISKDVMHHYHYTIREGIYYPLYGTRRMRRRLHMHVRRLGRDLYFGSSKSLDMIGMGFKHETTEYAESRINMAFSHYTDIDFNDDVVFFRKRDKFLVLFSGSRMHLNDVYSKLLGTSKLSKYKEKGIIDHVTPPKLRIRKEKRR
jgi:hypothetical protein